MQNADQKSTSSFVTAYITQFYCFDNPENWKLLGHSNSEIGSSLSIAIKKCEGTKCRTPEELEEYAKLYSFTSISNYDEYQPSKYGDETIKRTIRSDPLVPLDLEGDARFFMIKRNVVASKEDLLGI